MYFEFKTITPEELEQSLANGENLNLVDVREPDEITKGMIPGARHINIAEIPYSLHLFDKEKEYILICQSGTRSQMGCEFLDERGFKVVNMVGGMNRWQGELSK